MGLHAREKLNITHNMLNQGLSGLCTSGWLVPPVFGDTELQSVALVYSGGGQFSQTLRQVSDHASATPAVCGFSFKQWHCRRSQFS